MKALTSLLALGLATAISAQSPLTTLAATYPANSTFVWTGTTFSPNMFYNLTVNTTVTIDGLDVQLYTFNSPAGSEGRVEMYVTNTATTYVGNETNIAAWTLRGSGPCTSQGAAASRVCFSPAVTLQPGTYGIAIHYVDLFPLFLLGNSTAVPGGAGAGTNQFYQTSEMTLLAGTAQAVSFGSGALASYVWLGSVHYGTATAPSGCAENRKFGKGCNTTQGSFYQQFLQPNLTAAALNGRAISLVFTGNGYALVPGSGVAFVPPPATATVLTGFVPDNDDGELPVMLTNFLPYPGGATQQLFVHSNGFVSLAPNLTQTPNDFTPNIPGLLDSPQTAFWSWHDFNTLEAGSGQIKFHEVGPVAYITWDGVESYPANTPQVINLSTWQFQFDTSTGQVNYVWQSMTNIGGSLFNDRTVVGFSPGGPSPNSGPIDLTTLTALNLTVPEVFPLTLDASPAALPGNTVNITTSNETGMNLGINFLSAAAVQPGIPLAILGMPGCDANVDINQGVGNLISNLGLPGTSMTLALPIPAAQPSLFGLKLFSQSVWLDPTANAFGAITSNGVSITIGNY